MTVNGIFGVSLVCRKNQAFWGHNWEDNWDESTTCMNVTVALLPEAVAKEDYAMWLCYYGTWSHKRGRSRRLAVGIPPHSSVDVDVLHKQRHQQVEKEQELKQQAVVQGEIWNTRVSNRLRCDERRQRWSRESHGVTVPWRETNKQKKQVFHINISCLWPHNYLEHALTSDNISSIIVYTNCMTAVFT